MAHHHHRKLATAEYEQNVLDAFQDAVNAASTLQAEMWLSNVSAGKQNAASSFVEISPANIVVNILDGIYFEELVDRTFVALDTLRQAKTALKRHQAKRTPTL